MTDYKDFKTHKDTPSILEVMIEASIFIITMGMLGLFLCLLSIV